MMKAQLLLVSTLLVSSCELFANGTIEIEPFIASEFGSTLFRMQVSEPIQDPPPDSGITKSIGQSELEYPLDVILAGMMLQKNYSLEGNRDLKIFTRGWLNLTDPGSKMQDTDWYGAGSNNFTSLYKFSYTQSDSSLLWAGGELGFEIGDYKLLGRNVAYGAKLSMDASSHKMYGIEGWQKFPGSERDQVNELQGVLVLTYKLLYVEPSAFVNFKLSQTKTLNWSILFSLSPFTVARDKDDHVLRNKTSETTAYGFGLGAINNLEIFIGPGVSFVADLRVRYIRTTGKMHQRYYGDDPGTNEDETGLTFRNIDNIISLFTQEIAIGMKWQF